MPGKLKVNGGQSTAVGMLVKVSGAWHGATSAFIKVGGVWKQWFKAAVLDSFNRTTSGSLGTADSGQNWNAVTGTWFANGSQAQSNDSPSNYSIATIDTGSANNIQTIGSTTNGTGASVWVTDSGDWFGVAAGQEVVNTVYYYTCGCSSCFVCTNPISGSSPGCPVSGGGYTVYYVYTYNCSTHAVGTYGGGSYLYYYYYYSCNYAVGSYYVAPYTYYTCTTYYSYCGGGYYYTCGCSSCQGGSVSYPAFVYVYQSVANTISQVLRTAISAVAASLKVVTSGGNTITVTTYSDSLTTPTDAPITYTASSAQTATQFGILLSPSQYNQGSTLDNYQSQND